MEPIARACCHTSMSFVITVSTASKMQHQIARVINWLANTTWQPLEGCWRTECITQSPGLYQIRRVGRENLDYIGQTGAGTMTLRRRLAMLAGVYQAHMPYRAPHTV